MASTNVHASARVHTNLRKVFTRMGPPIIVRVASPKKGIGILKTEILFALPMKTKAQFLPRRPIVLPSMNREPANTPMR